MSTGPPEAYPGQPTVPVEQAEMEYNEWGGPVTGRHRIDEGHDQEVWDSTQVPYAPPPGGEPHIKRAHDPLLDQEEPPVPQQGQMDPSHEYGMPGEYPLAGTEQLEQSQGAYIAPPAPAGEAVSGGTWYPDAPVPELIPSGEPLQEVRDPYEGYQHLQPPQSARRPPPQIQPHDQYRGRQPPQPNDLHAERGYSVHHRDVPPANYHGLHEEWQGPSGRDRRPDRSSHDRYEREGGDWYDKPRKRVPRYSDQDDRRPPRERSSSSGPQVQVYAANQPHAAPAAAPAAPGVNMGETMQMMMMSQILQQQMAAQQMQAAQMASMMGQNKQGGAGSGGCGQGSACGKKKGSTKVSIQGGPKVVRRVVRKKTESKPAVVVKKVAVPVRAPLLQPRIGGVEESGGFENWQEATIILCLMIVGLIYMVSSRASAPVPADDKKATQHLAGPG